MPPGFRQKAAERLRLRPGGEEVARVAGTIEMEQFMFGCWYICAATKPDNT